MLRLLLHMIVHLPSEATAGRETKQDRLSAASRRFFLRGYFQVPRPRFESLYEIAFMRIGLVGICNCSSAQIVQMMLQERNTISKARDSGRAKAPWFREGECMIERARGKAASVNDLETVTRTQHVTFRLITSNDSTEQKKAF